jgi:hypothetical protein
MHGDGVGHHLPAVGEHTVAIRELAGHRRAAHGEVDVRDGARKPGVVKHRGEVEQLTVERDPASCGEGGCPRVSAMRVVAQHRCEEILGRLLRVSGERRARGRKARRLDGGAASRMDAQGHRQQAGEDAELLSQQRPGQLQTLAGGEHAPGALGPSDRPERVAGACAAAAIGGGGRGHRPILSAGRPGGHETHVASSGRLPGGAASRLRPKDRLDYSNLEQNSLNSDPVGVVMRSSGASQTKVRV